ncbi:Branched-chain amino acid ABC transporter, periplasmic amino acid-binding protein, partial [Pseudomonas syringae pv. atrofaciens]
MAGAPAKQPCTIAEPGAPAGQSRVPPWCAPSTNRDTFVSFCDVSTLAQTLLKLESAMKCTAAKPSNNVLREQSMKRRSLIKAFTLSASIAAMGLTWTVQAAETIKVGILHSLSGTMAISETSLKDMALMTIDEINAKGGVNGKMLEPVVVDPASNWPLFAEKGRQLLTQDKVAVVFGCWTSVSRKSVLPVFEELNGLLFYPVQYEGEEMSPNVFYTGAAPNQQAIPAVEYVMSEDGGSAKRFFLLGTDYV